MNQFTLEKPAKRKSKQPHCRQTVAGDRDIIHIPEWVVDHASFRQWYYSDEFPETKHRICYLDGEVWIDMSREQLFTHNQVKGEFARVLGNLVKENRLGRYFPDGVMITNTEAGLSSVPDGVFVSRQSFEQKRVWLVEGAKKGYIELEGSPDMVLEVISDSSVKKDAKTLHELYQRAAVREYWLVDARGQELQFDIFRYASKSFTAARKQKGWLKSHIFGKSFHLTQQTDELGKPEYALQVR